MFFIYFVRNSSRYPVFVLLFAAVEPPKLFGIQLSHALPLAEGPQAPVVFYYFFVAIFREMCYISIWKKKPS